MSLLADILGFRARSPRDSCSSSGVRNSSYSVWSRQCAFFGVRGVWDRTVLEVLEAQPQHNFPHRSSARIGQELRGGQA